MTGRLSGKVAIVTGAARGMGSAHAAAMALQGAKVMMTDIADDSSARLAESETVRFLLHDVTRGEDWERVVGATEAAFGRLDILVNNAGIADKRSLRDSSEADYRRVIDTNQVSVFLGMKTAAAAMRRSGGGSIVNVSSVLGVVGGADQIAYTASKFAVRGMTKAAAAELGTDNIRVNSIHPGAIATPMTQAAGNAMDGVIATFPIPRRGSPAEVSSLVVFLASDESSYITGAEIMVDGGWTCTW